MEKVIFCRRGGRCHLAGSMFADTVVCPGCIRHFLSISSHFFIVDGAFTTLNQFRGVSIFEQPSG